MRLGEGWQTRGFSDNVVLDTGCMFIFVQEKIAADALSYRWRGGAKFSEPSFETHQGAGVCSKR